MSALLKYTSCIGFPVEVRAQATQMKYSCVVFMTIFHFFLTDQVDRREGIHSSVHSDVSSVFKGKTYTQLIALEKQIYSKISSGDAVDIGKYSVYQCSIIYVVVSYLVVSYLS
jgi:hypothetical protein